MILLPVTEASKFDPGGYLEGKHLLWNPEGIDSSVSEIMSDEYGEHQEPPGSSEVSIEAFANNLNLTCLTFLCKINIEGF